MAIAASSETPPSLRPSSTALDGICDSAVESFLADGKQVLDQVWSPSYEVNVGSEELVEQSPAASETPQAGQPISSKNQPLAAPRLLSFRWQAANHPAGTAERNAGAVSPQSHCSGASSSPAASCQSLAAGAKEDLPELLPDTGLSDSGSGSRTASLLDAGTGFQGADGEPESTWGESALSLPVQASHREGGLSPGDQAVGEQGAMAAQPAGLCQTSTHRGPNGGQSGLPAAAQAVQREGRGQEGRSGQLRQNRDLAASQHGEAGSGAGGPAGGSAESRTFPIGGHHQAQSGNTPVPGLAYFSKRHLDTSQALRALGMHLDSGRVSLQGAVTASDSCRSCRASAEEHSPGVLDKGVGGNASLAYSDACSVCPATSSPLSHHVSEAAAAAGPELPSTLPRRPESPGQESSSSPGGVALPRTPQTLVIRSAGHMIGETVEAVRRMRMEAAMLAFRLAEAHAADARALRQRAGVVRGQVDALQEEVQAMHTGLEAMEASRSWWPQAVREAALFLAAMGAAWGTMEGAQHWLRHLLGSASGGTGRRAPAPLKGGVLGLAALVLLGSRCRSDTWRRMVDSMVGHKQRRVEMRDRWQSVLERTAALAMLVRADPAGPFQGGDTWRSQTERRGGPGGLTCSPLPPALMGGSSPLSLPPLLTPGQESTAGGPDKRQVEAAGGS